MVAGTPAGIWSMAQSNNTTRVTVDYNGHRVLQRAGIETLESALESGSRLHAVQCKRAATNQQQQQYVAAGA